jgi:drug/metabolite transporter (DMT)-like permease
MVRYNSSKGALPDTKLKSNVKNTLIGIFLVTVCTLMTAFGQLLMRFGARGAQHNIFILITNPFILGGYALFFIGSIFMLYALKQNELSLMYPFVSLGFVWVAIFSLVFLGERLVFMQWIALLVIIFGVSLVAKGAMSHG